MNDNFNHQPATSPVDLLTVIMADYVVQLLQPMKWTYNTQSHIRPDKTNKTNNICRKKKQRSPNSKRLNHLGSGKTMDWVFNKQQKKFESSNTRLKRKHKQQHMENCDNYLPASMNLIIKLRLRKTLRIFTHIISQNLEPLRV